MKLLASFIVVVLFPRAVGAKTFSIDNCVRLDVEGTFEVDALRDGKKEFSFQVDMVDTVSSVSGSCSPGDTSRSMTVHFNHSGGSQLDWTLVFTTKGDRSDMDQMVKFTPSSLFGNDTLPDELVSLTDIGDTLLSLTNESFACEAERRIPYDSKASGDYNFTVSQVVRNLQVQAFNLKGTAFGPAVHCSDDLKNRTTPATEATTQPTTPTTPSFVENTFVVLNKFGNVSCIVLRGDIAFTNIVYNATEGGQRTADPISIPRFNTTAEFVVVSGSCAEGNGSDSSSEQMTITFNGDWNLTFTFARGSDETSSLLGAVKRNEYSLRDIQFDYVLTPQFFPNVSNSGTRWSAKAENLTDFLKGSMNGGSYKCVSKIQRTLDNGVTMETKELQYKAFNLDRQVGFSDNDVSECPADEGTDHTVAIAVGAALGSLILIMCIAYVIGRHNRRQKGGYDSF